MHRIAIKGSRGVVEFIWGANNLPGPFEKMHMLPRKSPDQESEPLYADATWRSGHCWNTSRRARCVRQNQEQRSRTEFDS